MRDVGHEVPEVPGCRVPRACVQGDVLLGPSRALGALDPVVADCDDWIKDFASEVERMLGSMLGSVDSDTYNDPVVPEHLERLVDFVVAREEMKARARAPTPSRVGDVEKRRRYTRLSRWCDPKVLKMLRGAARHFNAADRGTGDVTLPSDINQRYMIALDSILGIRQGRDARTEQSVATASASFAIGSTSRRRRTLFT